MSLSSVKRNLRLFAQLQLECIITSERKHTLQTEIEKFSLLDEQYSAKTSYMNTMLKKCTWWGLHALFPMRLFFNYKKIISSLRLWIITASVFCILNSLKNLFFISQIIYTEINLSKWRMCFKMYFKASNEFFKSLQQLIAMIFF